MKRTVLIMLLLVASIAVVSQADTIVKPVDATASSIMGTGYAPQESISSSGLSFGLETGADVPMTWPAHNAVQEDHWISADDAWGSGKWVAFDLGATYTLTGMHVWNYNNTFIDSSRGAKDVLVQYQVGADWLDAENFVFARGASSYSGYTGEDYTFTNSITAQNVRFWITSNQGGTGANNYASIAEVRFTAVPEPMTISLLAFGGLHLLKPKRK